MIYRVDFELRNSAVKLISPVIFGNIARTYFEILDEGQALVEINRLITSKTLISDAFDYDIKELLDYRHKEFNVDELKLKEKRQKYREYKKILGGRVAKEDVYRLRRRTAIDRRTLSAQNKMLFNQIERINNRKNSIYINTDDEKVIELFELALIVLEKTGIGTRRTIGMGEVNFIKNNNRIFQKDTEVQKLYNNSLKYNKGISISSIIVDKNTIRDIDFINYKIDRYDSKSGSLVKPPYYYAKSGCSIEFDKITKAYLKKYKTVFIYTCPFPIYRGDCDE